MLMRNGITFYCSVIEGIIKIAMMNLKRKMNREHEIICVHDTYFLTIPIL